MLMYGAEREEDLSVMKRISVALLGFGVAGQAFSRILLKTHDAILRDTGYDAVVTAIVTGSRGTLYNPQGLDLAEALRQMNEEGRFDEKSPDFSSMNAFEIVDTAEYDVVCELTPLNIETGLPAVDHIRRALNRGKHVISANKGPVARFYRELKNLAGEKGVCLFFETTVMAGTPLLNLADECLPYCKIDRIEGILNATTNYILKEMAKGVPEDEIVRRGREEGFMEADISMDTEGWDATAKLTVLMNVLMDAGVTPDDIDRTGIGSVTAEDIKKAAERGNDIKLMCTAERTADGKIYGKVAPEEIPDRDVFSDENLVAVVSLYTDLMGKITVLQYGLETTQTGYGVFSDLIRVIKNISR